MIINIRAQEQNTCHHDHTLEMQFLKALMIASAHI